MVMPCSRDQRVDLDLRLVLEPPTIRTSAPSAWMPSTLLLGTRRDMQMMAAHARVARRIGEAAAVIAGRDADHAPLPLLARTAGERHWWRRAA